MKVSAIIPARFESSRLPGKVLKEIDGQSMLFRVYQKAKEANIFHDIIVATDHPSIVDHCLAHKMKVQMTSKDHVSGTDRIAEVAQSLEADAIVNIQADEPFIEIESIRSVVYPIRQKGQIATLCKKITNDTDLFDYNVVKLVKDSSNRALYFSRQAIPAQRDLPYKNWLSKTDYFQHLGIYAFQKNVLLKLVTMEPSSLEVSEKLEQLRWLQSGYKIYCREVETNSFGIDTPEDLERARSLYK